MTGSIEIKTVDGMYIRQEVIPAQHIRPQHSHEFDHSSLLAQGCVILWVDGKPSGRYKAPSIIVIRAGQRHAFQALGEPALIYCLHNLHGGQWPRILAELDLEEALTFDG